MLPAQDLFLLVYLFSPLCLPQPFYMLPFHPLYVPLLYTYHSGLLQASTLLRTVIFCMSLYHLAQWGPDPN